MKTIAHTLTILACFLFMNTCEKQVWNNPWDDNSNLNDTEWAPGNLQFESESINSVRLVWEYGNYNIGGFRVDRKEGNDNWHEGYASLSEDIRSWTDGMIKPDSGLTYSYRIYAFAGNNYSAYIESSFQPSFPAPINLKLEQISDSGFMLTWHYYYTGHEGFRIYRKKENGEWEPRYIELSADARSYIDFEVDLFQYGYTYRVLAYFGSYTSGEAELYAALPRVSMPEVISLSGKNATLEGEVTYEGSSAVTKRGVVWSTYPNPILQANLGMTSDGAGIGTFISQLNGLSRGTTYYIRAYATNSEGTAYGRQKALTNDSIVFFDDFSNNQHNWGIRSGDFFDYHISNGYYHISYNNPGYYIRLRNTVEDFQFIDDFEMQLKFILIDNFTDGYVGFDFNLVYDNNLGSTHRQIRISSTGYVGCNDRVNDNWVSPRIYGSYDFDGYTIGSQKYLKIVKSKGEYKIYINNILVSRFMSVNEPANSGVFGIIVSGLHIKVDEIGIYTTSNKSFKHTSTIHNIDEWENSIHNNSDH